MSPPASNESGCTSTTLVQLPSGQVLATASSNADQASAATNPSSSVHLGSLLGTAAGGDEAGLSVVKSDPRVFHGYQQAENPSLYVCGNKHYEIIFSRLSNWNDMKSVNDGYFKLQYRIYNNLSIELLVYHILV